MGALTRWRILGACLSFALSVAADVSLSESAATAAPLDPYATVAQTWAADVSLSESAATAAPLDPYATVAQTWAQPVDASVAETAAPLQPVVTAAQGAAPPPSLSAEELEAAGYDSSSAQAVADLGSVPVHEATLGGQKVLMLDHPLALGETTAAAPAVAAGGAPLLATQAASGSFPTVTPMALPSAGTTVSSAEDLSAAAQTGSLPTVTPMALPSTGATVSSAEDLSAAAQAGAPVLTTPAASGSLPSALHSADAAVSSAEDFSAAAQAGVPTLSTFAAVAGFSTVTPPGLPSANSLAGNLTPSAQAGVPTLSTLAAMAGFPTVTPPGLPSANALAGNLPPSAQAGVPTLSTLAAMAGFSTVTPPGLPSAYAMAGNLPPSAQAGFPAAGSLPAVTPTVPQGFLAGAPGNATTVVGAGYPDVPQGGLLANASGVLAPDVAAALASLNNGSLQDLDAGRLESILNGSLGAVPPALEGLNASTLEGLLNIGGNGPRHAKNKMRLRKAILYKLSGQIKLKFNMTSCSLASPERMTNISKTAIALACGISETNFTKFTVSSNCGRRLSSAERRLSTDTETIDYEVELPDSATADAVKDSLKDMSDSSSLSHELFTSEMEANYMPVEEVDVGEVQTEEEGEAEESDDDVMRIFWWVLGISIGVLLLVLICVAVFLYCRRDKPKVAPIRQAPDAYLTGKVPFNKEAELEERYIKLMLDMEQVITAWAGGQMANLEAKAQADALLKQIEAIGTLHSSTHVEELLDKHGLTDTRRVVLEDHYRDLQRACGAEPEAVMGTKKKSDCSVM